MAPYSGACYDLADGVWIREGIKEYIKKEKEKTPGRRQASAVFERLSGSRTSAEYGDCA